MCKKVIVPAAVLILLAAALILSELSWIRGEQNILDYAVAHCDLDLVIVDSEFLEGGMDEEGGYKLFRVSTPEDGEYLLRVNVRYRRRLTQIGPECRVLGVGVRTADDGKEWLRNYEEAKWKS